MTMPSVPVRTRLAPWLSLILLLATLLTPVARAQNAAGLDSINAEYHDLLDLFYRPLQPRDLLVAGWTALGSDASRHGAPQPPQLPDLPDDPNGAFDTFAAAYSDYVASLPTSYTAEMAGAAVNNAMAQSLHERHTNYLPQSVLRQFLSLVGGGQEMVGLGIRLGGDPAGLITAVAPDGPAARAGVQPGDVIIRANDRELSGLDTPSLAAALAGPEGAAVSVTVDRGSGQMTVDITRGTFYFPPLESRMLSDGVGYLRLADFVISGRTLPNGGEVLADLDRQLDELDSQGAQSLILDLRDNGGGSVQTADELLGRFLPDTVRSVREADERGHKTFEIASGRTHSRQLPMAVLIDGGSASASEITAAALRDAHRAVLVGEKTAGAVASSELVPLPGGAGLQVAVATAATPDTDAQLDGVGVTPDVASAEHRTLADYRSGRDPQIESAVAALAGAPAPPTVPPRPAPLSAADLEQLLLTALPESPDLPTNDRLTSTDRWQRLDYTHPNELIDQNGGSDDPVALQQALLGRGYEGSVTASYGGAPGDLPAVSVTADLYATPDGAHGSATTNDLPQLQQPIDPPVRLGDETTAYRGTWIATGSTVLMWRRGRIVLTVTYSDAPGFDRPDTVSAIAQLVDNRAAHIQVP